MNQQPMTYKEGDKYYTVVTLKTGMTYYYGPFNNWIKARREYTKQMKQLKQNGLV